MTRHQDFSTDAASRVPALDALFREFETELRGLAGAIFSEQHLSHTLQPTALISEAWLKLEGKAEALQNREHFFALAARVMRQILIDHARNKGAVKRGGANHRVTFIESEFNPNATDFDAASFNDALARLEKLNERHAEVVQLRLLGMLSVSEISRLTGVSERTVKRDWQAARLWLMSELQDS